MMTLPQFEMIAKDVFPKTRILDLSCSYEPFMTKNFIDYVRVARHYSNGSIGLCTNGLLLNEQMIDTLFREALVDEIDISIDGLSEATYNSIRIGGNYNKLLEVLRMIKEAKITYPHKIIFRINYTMMERNIRDILSLYDFSIQYDIDVVQLRHVKLTAEFKPIFHESLIFHQDLYDRIIRNVINDFKAVPVKELIYPPLFCQTPVGRNIRQSCAYPWFNFTIDAHGSLNLCNIGDLGNILQNNFEKIDNSMKVRQIRKNLFKRYDIFQTLCAKCIYVSDLIDVHDRKSFIREDLVRLSYENDNY